MMLTPSTSIARRHFLRDCGVGLGKIAFAGLLSDGLSGRALAAAATPTPAVA